MSQSATVAGFHAFRLTLFHCRAACKRLRASSPAAMHAYAPSGHRPCCWHTNGPVCQHRRARETIARAEPAKHRNKRMRQVIQRKPMQQMQQKQYREQLLQETDAVESDQLVFNLADPSPAAAAAAVSASHVLHIALQAYSCPRVQGPGRRDQMPADDLAQSVAEFCHSLHSNLHAK